MKRLPGFDKIERSAIIGFGIFLATVLVGYASLLFKRTGTTLEQLTLIVLGLIYCTLGVAWFARCERDGPRSISAYFVTQLAIATAICYLGFRVTEGNIWIVPLPLISHAFILLPRRSALSVTALIVLLFGAAIALNTNVAEALRSMLGYLPGAFFVAAFSRIAVEQGQARGEIEKLAVQLREANRKLAEYAGQVEELATTRERNRLAREVHDSLGHYLTVVNMQLEAARAVLARDPEKASDAMAKAQSLTKEGLNEVRRSVAALRAGPMGNHSLSDAIGLLVTASRETGIDAELVLEGAPLPLAPHAEMLLYRAAQEGLTNVRKHSNASRAELRLRFESKRATLTVHDSGGARPSPDTAAHGDSGGFGLLGLRERAHLLGGSVATSAEAGFTLSRTSRNQTRTSQNV